MKQDFLIKDLIPTHNELRNPYWFLQTIKNKPDIDFGGSTILITEDERQYVLDGHHRLAYMRYLDEVNNTESGIHANVVKYTYQEMQEINFKCGYVTPFNPKTECRKPDFLLYKQTLLGVRDSKTIGAHARYGIEDKDWLLFIEQNKAIYCEPRRVYNLKDLYVGLDCGSK